MVCMCVLVCVRAAGDVLQQEGAGAGQPQGQTGAEGGQGARKWGARLQSGCGNMMTVR